MSLQLHYCELEQNVDVALELCDRFMVVRNGETVFEGVRSDFGEDPVVTLGALCL
jgi:ABC-type branched-subunit amino acid transport system ATPase component